MKSALTTALILINLATITVIFILVATLYPDHASEWARSSGEVVGEFSGAAWEEFYKKDCTVFM